MITRQFWGQGEPAPFFQGKKENAQKVLSISIEARTRQCLLDRRTRLLSSCLLPAAAAKPHTTVRKREPFLEEEERGDSKTTALPNSNT